MQVTTNAQAGGNQSNRRPDATRYAARSNGAFNAIGAPGAQHRLAVIAAGAALLFGLGGCGGGDGDPNLEGNRLAASMAASAITAGADAGGEQGVQAPTEATLIERVNAAWTYAIGGDTEPTTVFPCAGAPRNIEGLSTLRARLADGMTHSRGACNAASQGLAEIDGRTVIVYKVTCDGLDEQSANLVWNIPSQIEACWQGAGALWKIGNWSRSPDSDAPGGETRFDLDMSIDPEPARLTTPLSGPTGATGAAVYVVSKTPTTVAKWGTSFAYAPSGPAAGMPCSNSDLAPGISTSRTIQVVTSGNSVYRRCF